MGFGELFENQKVLIALPFLLLLLFYYKGGPRGGRVSSVAAYRQGSRLWRFLAVTLLYWCIGLLLVTSVLALANPGRKVLKAATFVHGYRSGLCIDNSGSMSGARIEAAKSALEFFVKKRDKDVFSFIPFSETALFSGAVKFTTDRALVIDAARRLNGDGTSTALGDGYLGSLVFLLNDVMPIHPATGKKELFVDFDQLKESFSSEGRSPETLYRETLLKRIGRVKGAFIVCFTDGDSNAGVGPVDAVQYIASFGVPSFLISVGTDQEPELVRALQKSGGGYFLANSEKDIASIMKKIDELNPVAISRGVVPKRESYRPFLAVIGAIFFCLAAICWALGRRIR